MEASHSNELMSLADSDLALMNHDSISSLQYLAMVNCLPFLPACLQYSADHVCQSVLLEGRTSKVAVQYAAHLCL